MKKLGFLTAIILCFILVASSVHLPQLLHGLGGLSCSFDWTQVGRQRFPVVLHDTIEDLVLLLAAQDLAQVAFAELRKLLALELIVSDETEAWVELLPHADADAVVASTARLRRAPSEQRRHHFWLGRVQPIHPQHLLHPTVTGTVSQVSDLNASAVFFSSIWEIVSKQG